jgi:CheY-like chemotaxis protein
VVEDNRDVGEFSTQLLEDLGYRTMFAADARSALNMIGENPDRFDLVSAAS